MEGKPEVEIQLSKDIIESIFLLKRADSSTNISVRVDFSPPSSPCKETTSSLVKSLPVFNNDGKHYTPSFIVDLDKPKYLENDQLYLSLHNQKTLEIEEEKTQLYVPKPSKANSFCCICKQPFRDYLTHVNIPNHQQLMKKSYFHTQIEHLCSIFTPETGNIVGKKKTIKKTGKGKKAQKSAISNKLIINKQKQFMAIQIC